MKKNKKKPPYMIDGEMAKFSVRVTAKAMRRSGLALKTIMVLGLISVSALSAAYLASVFINNIQAFSIRVDDTDSGQLISISETDEFIDPITGACLGTTYLEAEIIDTMDNITRSWLPDDLHELDGSNNGENYIAYSFYLANTGEETLDYISTVNILEVENNADEAIRVMVIKNGAETIYAKAQQGTSIPEDGTEMFALNTKVMEMVNEALQPGEIDKYTVVIWLEGADPECIDDIKGGTVRLNMEFKVQN